MNRRNTPGGSRFCGCGGERTRNSRYCRECKNRKAREGWARRKAALAVEQGRLQRLACCVCGAPGTRMRHEDFSRPLKVQWLCAGHQSVVLGPSGRIAPAGRDFFPRPGGRQEVVLDNDFAP